RPPPVAWLVEGLCARGALSLIAGQPKAGKSLVALALAGGVAAGEPAAGIRCRPGAALVVDAENSEAEIHRRLFGLDLDARAPRPPRARGLREPPRPAPRARPPSPSDRGRAPSDRTRRPAPQARPRSGRAEGRDHRGHHQGRRLA